MTNEANTFTDDSFLVVKLIDCCKITKELSSSDRVLSFEDENECKDIGFHETGNSTWVD